MIPYISFLLLAFQSVVFGQDLNIIPDLVRPYINNVDQLVSINVLANLQDHILKITKKLAKFDPISLRNDYDFIIVGSGPAGCVLANRLSANPNWNVLLIEAGQPESVIQLIPAFASLSTLSSYIWDYVAEEYPNSCLGFENNRCAYPRGRALGGSSVVNFLVYGRGHKYDYDLWEKMGNKGWSYEDILPLYKKIERADLGEFSQNHKYRSENGSLSIQFPQYRSMFSNLYLKAWQELGLDVVDYNADNMIGVSYIQSTTLNGKRHSAASAYLDPIYLKRNNLHIMTNSLVSKILIDENTKTAYGVQFYYKKQTFRVFANKEVIISAGAFNSPQLLMLSGIGPKEHLEDIGIPVIQDLPVGKNMFDHGCVIAPTFITNTTKQSVHIKNLGLLEVLDFLKGKGKLTSLVGMEALSFHSTPYNPFPKDYPDIEIILMAGGIQSDYGTGFKKLANIKQEVYDAVYKPIESSEIDTWTASILSFHPKAKGEVLLRDDSIFSPPILKYPFYENEDDIEILLFGIKEIIKLSKTDAMQSIGSRIHDTPLPNCAHFEFGTDDYWRCFIRHLGFGLQHQTATNKMGPENDSEAVVSPELKIYGVKNLRVADTSVVPTSIAAHTNAVSFLVGEKLANLLLETWLN